MPPVWKTASWDFMLQNIKHRTETAVKQTVPLLLISYFRFEVFIFCALSYFQITFCCSAFVHSVLCFPTSSLTHLSTVRDVDNGVGLLLEEPLVQSGQVRRVIGVAAVGLDDGQGKGKTRGKDDFSTLVQLHEAWREKGGTEWNSEREYGWQGDEGTYRVEMMVLNRETDSVGMIGGQRKRIKRQWVKGGCIKSSRRGNWR